MPGQDQVSSQVSQDFQIVYQYVLSGSLKKKASSDELRKSYKILLEHFSEIKFDGLAQLKTSGDENDPLVEITLSSKNNVLNLEVSNFELRLSAKNPLKDKESTASFHYSSEDFIELVKDIDQATALMSKFENVSIREEEAVLSHKKPEQVASKIFSRTYAAGAFGYTASFMQHINDPDLDGGHVHSTLAIYNAFISEMRDGELRDALDELSPYMVSKEYVFSAKEGSITSADVYSFLDKYYLKASLEVGETISALGLGSKALRA